jgi:hypothetical protein
VKRPLCTVAASDLKRLLYKFRAVSLHVTVMCYVTAVAVGQRKRVYSGVRTLSGFAVLSQLLLPSTVNRKAVNYKKGSIFDLSHWCWCSMFILYNNAACGMF